MMSTALHASVRPFIGYFIVDLQRPMSSLDIPSVASHTAYIRQNVVGYKGIATIHSGSDDL